ncbi:hypothetical protein F2P56_007309 [Juglans regia]|uniref:Uncharacterized protein LOC108981413 n=2 Tax=Juglans regia TaxID=51240 RepID=A0A2I4DLT2_JUGRE|nr:uncharacterized protein LOC108981413 [Juglans regia]KAF5475509.1 hypothetical protein F2P56_007309 [Juglans regia]
MGKAEDEIHLQEAWKGLHEWLHKEEIFMARKAKAKWIKEGDANTKFFHGVFRDHRRKAWVEHMELHGGQVLRTPIDVRDGVVDYFHKLLQSKVHIGAKEDIRKLVKSTVSKEENVNLVKLPSMEETLKAMKSISEDSSPRPDSFGASFFISCWDIVGSDVLKAEFFSVMPLGPYYTSTFLELLRSFNKKTRGGNIMLKLDMMKAYDRLEWSFLWEALYAYGFSEKFIGLLKNCVQNCSFSVMLNGTYRGYFQSSIGVRQGDPLSPYLFILAEEVFTRMVKQAVDLCRIKPLAIPRVSTQVSHLIYVDDVVFFLKADKKSVKGLMEIIERYSKWSGQKVNTSPSVIGVRCFEDLLKKVRVKLDGWKVMDVPKIVIRKFNSIFASFLWGGMEDVAPATPM